MVHPINETENPGKISALEVFNLLGSSCISPPCNPQAMRPNGKMADLLSRSGESYVLTTYPFDLLVIHTFKVAKSALASSNAAARQPSANGAPHYKK
jgi:hypothetical protein